MLEVYANYINFWHASLINILTNTAGTALELLA
jgi:hypothetical protein